MRETRSARSNSNASDVSKNGGRLASGIRLKVYQKRRFRAAEERRQQALPLLQCGRYVRTFQVVHHQTPEGGG